MKHKPSPVSRNIRGAACTGTEETGKILGVGYTSVSQERRRRAEEMKKDRKLKELDSEIEDGCQ